MIRLPERQLETTYDLCLEQICSQHMVNWLAGMLVFSHSCGLVGSAMFGPAATAALCLKGYSCRVDPFVQLFEGASGLAERTCH